MIAGIVTIWFMLLGLSVVAGKASGGKWFINASKNAAMKPLKAAGKATTKAGKGAFQKFWCAYKSEIMAFCGGVGLMKLSFQTPLGLWILAISLLFIVGWLIGLAIANYQGRIQQQDYLEWSRDKVVAGASWLRTNHASETVCFCLGCTAALFF